MPDPAFFDIFGAAAFAFIIAATGWALGTRAPLSRWVLLLFLIIGVIGFLVDGTIVYMTYLRPVL